MEEKFFELLRYSIGASDKMRHLSDEEWHTMYDMAQKQSLIGIVFAGISRLPVELLPPKMIKLSC
jgi:hypothetical protein